MKPFFATLWVADTASHPPLRVVLREVMPRWLQAPGILELDLWQWVGLLFTAAGAYVIGRVGEWALLGVARRMTRYTRLQWDEILVESGKRTLRLPLMAAVLVVGSVFLDLPGGAQAVVERVAQSLAILAMGVFSVRFVNEGAKHMGRRLDEERAADPYRARGIETQVMVLRRILVIGSYLLTGALFLLQFQPVRSLGLSLLASAGVAGLIIGLAAQKSISTLLAGIQLSITQPIRLGDKVVVEGEYGTIEEIRLTYVVVRVWDLRRLIVPMNQFLDKPFQNWTKSGTEILGVITLQVDYTADVDAFRAELKRLLQGEAKPLWNGRIQGVQVTEASERTQTLRVLVSAVDASTNWDLRCLLRERLIAFLRSNPRWLPTQRTATLPSQGTEPAKPS